jgi:hypothetical protein
MTDIVIKTIDEFKRDELSVQNKNVDDIVAKYVHIFSTYDCFSNKNVNTFFAPREKEVRQKHFHQSPSLPPNKQYRERRRKEKTIHEIVRGIINIINKTNYAKMFNTIRILSTQENISTIVSEILVNTCHNAFYIELFTKLVIDLAMVSGYRDAILAEITDFIHKFVEKKEYVFHTKADGNDYDIFCDQQKHKAYVLCKNNLIMNLHVEGIHNINVKDYVAHFINVIISNEYQDEYHKKLLLQIILDCISHDATIKSTSYTDILAFLQENNWASTKKLEFMVKELERKVYNNGEYVA